jgi:choline dehydrogenase-like flavoprotein
MLDRGRHVEPLQPGADELYRRATLLADGGLAAILDPALPLLSASSVGGGTNLGSGPLIRPGADPLDRWASLGPPNRSELEAALDRVSSGPAVRVVPFDADDGRVRLVERGLSDVADGVERLVGEGDRQLANRSAVDGPMAITQHKSGDGLVVLSKCAVTAIDLEAGKVRRLRCRLPSRRELEVRAARVVLAASAPQSSLLLRRSGVNGAGREMSLYVGAGLAGDFEEAFPLDSDLSASWRPGNGDRLVVRKEAFTLADEALRTPGTVQEHLRAMRRRRHQLALGVLIGSEPGAATVDDRGSLRVRLTEADMRRLRRGLELGAAALLHAGARFVVPAADRREEVRKRDQLSAKGLWLTTAYPLGGNALSADPARGIVGPDFRVHGHQNLFVCDASVLPVSLDVDPQLTVMALATLAARRILDA